MRFCVTRMTGAVAASLLLAGCCKSVVGENRAHAPREPSEVGLPAPFHDNYSIPTRVRPCQNPAAKSAECKADAPNNANADSGDCVDVPPEQIRACQYKVSEGVCFDGQVQPCYQRAGSGTVVGITICNSASAGAGSYSWGPCQIVSGIAGASAR
jgi:hypothetical protein